MRRRWAGAILVIPVLVGLGWWTTRIVADRRFTAGLARAKSEIISGRWDEPRRWLSALPPSRLADPEAADLLGVCEHMAGHYEAALASWSLIAPNSPRGHAAALAHAEL